MTSNNAMFNVPNNKEGRQFIESMRKFLNRDKYRWRRWSRGKRKGLAPFMLCNRARNREELKVKFGESWAVYIDRKDPEYNPTYF
jgi:hypothetical protein